MAGSSRNECRRCVVVTNADDAPRRNRFSDERRHRALKVIEQCYGNLTVAAQRLGISIPTLSRWRKISAP